MLVVYPNEVLISKAAPVTKFDASLRSLLKNMEKEMMAEKGIGIAAPQVGVSLRCFHARIEKDIFTFVNPTITSFSQECDLYEEGCLSIPGVYAEVERPILITVEAQDRKGEKFSMNADGLLARIIQHEYDHLDGVLFIDRIAKPAKKIILKEYTALQQAKNA